MSNYKYYLKNIINHNNDVVVLELADINGLPVFAYKPGQYVMIAYFNEAGKITQRHAFSIASSPSRNDSLFLGIKIGGRFTKGLLNLKVGAPISVAGPYGNFIFKPSIHKDLVLIAGGIGITPFLSTLTYATDNNLPNKLSLLYSVRTLANANFYDDIKELASKNSNLKTLLSVTDEAVAFNTPGIINQRIDNTVLQNFLGEVHNKTFFICGPGAFMTAIKNDLISLGVDETKIEMEAFSMLNDKKLGVQFRNFLYATGFSAAALAMIFYSISSSAEMTKALKSAASSLNPKNLINNTASDLQNQQVAPNPITSVSGMPINNSTIPNSSIPTKNNSQPSNSFNSSTTTPQPTTSTSIPVQNQRPTNSSLNTNTSTKRAVVAPAPVTASSAPINQSVINNGGYSDDGRVDD